MESGVQTPDCKYASVIFMYPIKSAVENEDLTRIASQLADGPIFLAITNSGSSLNQSSLQFEFDTLVIEDQIVNFSKESEDLWYDFDGQLFSVGNDQFIGPRYRNFLPENYDELGNKSLGNYVVLQASSFIANGNWLRVVKNEDEFDILCYKPAKIGNFLIHERVRHCCICNLSSN